MADYGSGCAIQRRFTEACWELGGFSRHLVVAPLPVDYGPDARGGGDDRPEQPISYFRPAQILQLED